MPVLNKFKDGKYAFLNDNISELYYNNKGNISMYEIARILIEQFPERNIPFGSLRMYVTDYIKEHHIDRDVKEENVRLAKQKQKAMDKNRIANKSFREYARIENAVEEYGKNLTEINKQYGKELSKLNISPIKKSKAKSGVGIMQITDVHGNEMIDLPHNKYDFEVLSRRLKKYVDRSLSYFKYKNVEKVLIAFTGDLLNSDRRLDELLNAATNRSKATVLMIHLLKQAILEVRNAGYPIQIISVLGNESRVTKEMTFSNEAFSDNYDFTIVAQLKQIFEFSGIKGIDFGSHDTLEVVIDVGGQNWLIAHDLTKFTDNQIKAQAAIGRYSLQNIKIDFLMGGHIHANRITDVSSRSGSMSGSNSYNENALNLMGRASGVCYTVRDGERSIQTIDLQDADNEGYEIVSKIAEYNVKSNLKLKKPTVIHKIII